MTSADAAGLSAFSLLYSRLLGCLCGLSHQPREEESSLLKEELGTVYNKEDI